MTPSTSAPGDDLRQPRRRALIATLLALVVASGALLVACWEPARSKPTHRTWKPTGGGGKGGGGTSKPRHHSHEHAHGSHPHPSGDHHHHPHPHPHLPGPNGHHHPY